MSSWANLLASALVAILGAGGVSMYLARSQKGKYRAEAVDIGASTATKLGAQADLAIARADRCMQRLEQLEQHIDRLEDILRHEGITVPAMPAPLPWPTPRSSD